MQFNEINSFNFVKILPSHYKIYHIHFLNNHHVQIYGSTLSI